MAKRKGNCLGRAYSKVGQHKEDSELPGGRERAQAFRSWHKYFRLTPLPGVRYYHGSMREKKA